MATKKPKIIVFDLDYTLWPFWVDSHPPFKKGSDGVIVDSKKSKVKCYPDVPEVLETLHNEGYILGAASRTWEIEGARQLIELFGWDKYFTYIEIFPGSKVAHFNNIKKQSEVDFTEMMFFDDAQLNIQDINQLGVLSVFVSDGVTRRVIADALKVFSSQRS